MLLVLLLIVCLLASYSLVLAGEGKRSEEVLKSEILADRNGNKIFDNLEERLEKLKDNDRIDVIVLFEEEVNEKFLNGVRNRVGSFEVEHSYPSINGVATKLTKGQVIALSKMPFTKQIEFDGEVQAFLQTANYWFGATKARTDYGVTGNRDGNELTYTKDDVTIVIIDTGIDPNHVDLGGGKIIGWVDYVKGQANPYDDNGHGTHVASIAAGTGAANVQYIGVAPGSALVGLKVLDRRGSGSFSNVNAAIQWSIDNKVTYGIDVINLSLGASGCGDGTSSTALLIDAAFDAGIVPVVAAGNSGPATCTVGTPGDTLKGITVGSFADVGESGFFLSYFSSRGPTSDGRIKPDIAAPGHNITAARSGTTGGYVTYSGTSMATPFVAGTVALMLDANPGLSPQQVKDTLASTAHDWGPTGKDIDYGSGRLDSFLAVKAAGNYSGQNVALPNHYYRADSLPGSGYSDYWEFDVTSTSYPIAITFIMPEWRTLWPRGSTPDFDLYLFNPSGQQVASATGTQRQETLMFQPTTTGTYTLRVYSYSGSGSYFFDLSVGGQGPVLVGNNQ